MPWAFSDIKTKTRQLSGRLSSNQLSDSKLGEYINNYYQFTFPAEVKLEREHVYYEFETEANVQEYDLPQSTYTNVEPPFYLDLMPLLYYQDPTVYFAENPEQISRQTPWTGDGTEDSFTTTVQFPQLLEGSVIVTDNVEVFNDDGEGNLDGNLGGTGTVDYFSGEIIVNFASPPADGQVIYVSFEQIMTGRPTAVLNYDNKFRFYTVPDTLYRARIKAYKIPDALVAATDKPNLEEWGECLAYGAARQIVMDFGESDRYSELTALYQEQVSYILTRTAQNLMNMRAMPSF